MERGHSRGLPRLADLLPIVSIPIGVGGGFVKRGFQQALVVLGDAVHVIEQRGDHLGFDAEHGRAKMALSA